MLTVTNATRLVLFLTEETMMRLRRIVCLLLLASAQILAQSGAGPSTTVPVPGNCLTEMRTGSPDAIGCYMAGSGQVGVAPSTPLFWHLDVFETRALAEAARIARGTVAEAHRRVWLFTIAEAEWRPSGGKRVARVGPLPLTPGRNYSVHYIDGVAPPAARTPPHRHSGPEAWYILEGTNCVMTPQGTSIAGAGATLIVPEGEPMVLTGIGSATRRTLAVIVYDSSLKSTSPAPDWMPKAGCSLRDPPAQYRR